MRRAYRQYRPIGEVGCASDSGSPARGAGDRLRWIRPPSPIGCEEFSALASAQRTQHLAPRTQNLEPWNLEPWNLEPWNASWAANGASTTAARASSLNECRSRLSGTD